MSRAMAGLPEGVANVHQATPAQLVDFIVTAGMEVDEIATDLDVHPRTVGLWRTGERWPQRRNWDNLMRLAARGAQRMTAPSTWPGVGGEKVSKYVPVPPTWKLRSRYLSHDDCPDALTKHTPCPSGFLAWSEWAAEKAKTHRQERCPTCGFWSIWKPKASGA